MSEIGSKYGGDKKLTLLRRYQLKYPNDHYALLNYDINADQE